MSTENSLHLEFDSLKLETESKAADEELAEKGSTSPEANVSESKERKKPYVNPERVKTGGSQRDKPTDDELAERIERIRQQNEKIKQRRQDVQADEEAFRKTQEVERAKLARTRQVQESVDSARERNAKRKMEKIASREWDSGKPSPSDWKARNQPSAESNSQQDNDLSQWVRGAGPRGSSRGRGRGRGSKRGGAATSPEPSEPEQEKSQEIVQAEAL